MARFLKGFERLNFLPASYLLLQLKVHVRSAKVHNETDIGRRELQGGDKGKRKFGTRGGHNFVQSGDVIQILMKK